MEKSIEKSVPPQMFELNLEAFRQGYEYPFYLYIINTYIPMEIKKLPHFYCKHSYYFFINTQYIKDLRGENECN